MQNCKGSCHVIWMSRASLRACKRHSGAEFASNLAQGINISRRYHLLLHRQISAPASLLHHCQRSLPASKFQIP